MKNDYFNMTQTLRVQVSLTDIAIADKAMILVDLLRAFDLVDKLPSASIKIIDEQIALAVGKA